MSYEFYRVLHLFGIFGVIMTLGGLTLHVMNGGNRNFANRKWAAILHGVGLVIVLVAGFGLVAREHISMAPPPPWLLVKLVIWLCLGVAPVLIYRKPALGKALFFLVWALAATAAIMAVYKPGA
jgi:uncharacterized membrane protein SirB2